MLVERRDDLDALRTVVYLVEHQPKPIHAMPPTMPPIENKRGDEVSNTPTNRSGNKSLQILKDGSETIWGLAALDEFFDQIFAGERLSQERIIRCLQRRCINRTQALHIRVFLAANGTNFHLIFFLSKSRQA